MTGTTNLPRALSLLSIIAFAGIAFAGLGTLPARAQPAESIGQVAERILVVGGKQIPLPEGRWIVAGRASVGYDGERVGAYGAIANLVLFRVNNGGVDAALEINTNALPVNDGWGVAADCRRTDLALAVIRYMAGWDGSCFFVTHTIAAPAPPAAWRQALATAIREHWALPAVWLTAGFRVGNRNDIVDARFHFVPAAFKIALENPARWKDSAWAPARLERDPARLAVATAVTEWAVLFSGHMEAGLKNRLSGDDVIAMPSRPGAPLVGGVVEQRLAALDDLLRAGAMTAEQHARHAARLRDRGLDPGSEVVDPATVALYKTLSYRPMVSLANVFIDYYWIGTPFAAGVLVLLQVTVNTTKFYFHELAWERIRGGGTRRDSARTIDFVYFGAGS